MERGSRDLDLEGIVNSWIVFVIITSYIRDRWLINYGESFASKLLFISKVKSEIEKNNKF